MQPGNPGILRQRQSGGVPASHSVCAAPTEQFAMVDVSVACRAAAGESYNVTESNFSLDGEAQKSYYPEFAMSLDGLNGLFDGGQIAPGESLSGDVVFVVDREAAGLTLRYSSFPGGPGPQALFALEP